MMEPTSLTGREREEALHAVAHLMQAGLPLVSGLRAFCEELEPGPIRNTLNTMAQRLECGESLAEVLGVPTLSAYAQGPASSAVDVKVERGQEAGMQPHAPIPAMIAAVAANPVLVPILPRYLVLHRQSRLLWQRTWSTLFYPALTFGTFVVLLVFLSVVVMPQFEEIFEDLGVLNQYQYSSRFPGPSVVVGFVHVTKIVRVLVEKGVVVVLALIVVWAYLWGRRMSPAGRGLWMRQLPGFGRLWVWTTYAEFCQMLALLLQAQCRLPQAIALAGRANLDGQLAAEAQSLAAQLEQGDSLAVAVGRSGHWDPLFAQAVGANPRQDRLRRFRWRKRPKSKATPQPPPGKRPMPTDVEPSVTMPEPDSEPDSGSASESVGIPPVDLVAALQTSGEVYQELADSQAQFFPMLAHMVGLILILGLLIFLVVFVAFPAINMIMLLSG